MNKKRGAFFYLQRCEFQVVHGNNFVLRVSQMAADAIGWNCAMQTQT